MPIHCGMTVSGPSAQVQLMESVLQAQKTRNDMSLAVLDKAQDVTRQMGDATIELIEKAGAQPKPGHFEALA